MRKIFIVFSTAFLLLFCSGCGESKIEIPLSDITEFIYQNTALIQEDYRTIVNTINTLSWKKDKDKMISPTFTINTVENSYQIEVTDKKLILKYKDTFYYSKNSEGIDTIRNTLKDVINNYNQADFYDISSQNDIIPTNEDLLIRLDQSDHYIVIQSSQPLYNFSIHRTEFIDDIVQDVNLLFQQQTISADTKVLIRSSQVGDLRIHFENQYHANISITMEKENDEIHFHRNFSY